MPHHSAPFAPLAQQCRRPAFEDLGNKWADLPGPSEYLGGAERDREPPVRNQVDTARHVAAHSAYGRVI